MKQYPEINTMPSFFSVTDIQKILGIGRNSAYELVRRSDFPSILVGNRIVVPADHFQSWVDGQATKHKGGESSVLRSQG